MYTKSYQTNNLLLFLIIFVLGCTQKQHQAAIHTLQAPDTQTNHKYEHCPVVLKETEIIVCTVSGWKVFK